MLAVAATVSQWHYYENRSEVLSVKLRNHNPDHTQGYTKADTEVFCPQNYNLQPVSLRRACTTSQSRFKKGVSQ